MIKIDRNKKIFVKEFDIGSKEDEEYRLKEFNKWLKNHPDIKIINMNVGEYWRTTLYIFYQKREVF